MPGPLFPQQYNSMQAQAGLTPMGTPQLPPIMVPMGMSMPQTPHPGAVAGMLQQQAMMSQYVSPQPSQIFGSTTMAQPSMYPGFGGPELPRPMYGYSNRARQIGVRESGSTLAMAQGAMGVGARMGGFALANTMLPGFGGMIYEGLGIGQGVQNVTNAMFSPIIQQRERALALQNASTGFVMGGSMLSATGQGMSGIAAQQVTSGLGRMADDPGFRRSTQGMFNRADLDRITRLSGELGMLDNSGSADQMLREVKRVSKAVSNFMKIVEEPDLQKAMQRMGQLRGLGFSTSDMPTAGANARAFARMAGVTMDAAMDTATRQSQVFVQAGLSGAAGFQASLGAQGMARQLAATMDPRRLSMAGGIEGIQQTMMGGAAAAATNTPFMMAMMRRGTDGQLSIDPSMLNQLATGRMSLNQMMRQAGSNVRSLGGRAAIDELFTRRNELQDQMTSMLGPQGQMLMPLLQARMIQRTTGGSLGEALRNMGMDETQARTYEQMGQNPEFFTNMRRQMQISMRERAVEERDRIRERSTAGAAFGRAMHHTVGRHLDALGSGFMEPIQRALAEEQDREEALALQGEGPARVIRGAGTFGTEVFRAGTRDLLRNRGRSGQRFREMMYDTQRAAGARFREEQETDATLQNIPFARMFHGPQGWGLTRALRGGDTYRSTVMEGAGLGARFRESLGFGLAASAEEVETLGREQEGLTRLMDAGTAGSAQEQIQRGAQARAAFGNTPDSRRTGARAQAAATIAIQNYIKDQYSLGGMVRTGTATESGMREAVRARLLSQGISAEEADRAMQDSNFMSSAMRGARTGMSDSQLAQFDEIRQQGATSSAAFIGGNVDNTRGVMESERNTVESMLGLDTGINTSAEGRKAVTNILAGGDEDTQALREKLFTALLMATSDDDTVRQQGLEAINQLEDEYGPELVNRVRGEVESEMNALSESDKEDMLGSLEGESFEERSQYMSRAAHHVRRAQAAEAGAAETTVLGRAAEAYGTERDVSALRRDPSKIANARIREMVQNGASDEEIQTAIEEATAQAITTEEGATATGTEATQEDQQAATMTEGMIAAITSGMQEFPTATTRLSEASRALSRSAAQLSDVADAIRVGAGHDTANGPRR